MILECLSMSSKIKKKRKSNKDSTSNGRGVDVVSSKDVKDDAKRLIAELVSVRQETYSGPIPQASELEKYEKVLPGSADRIIKMAESQSEHRHELEKRVVVSNITNEKRGMNYAFTLTLSLMIFGAVLIFTDKETAGYFALFGPVVFQGGNFVYHKRRESQVSRQSTKDKKEEDS